MDTQQLDAAILGGGLAGLTLALHLKQKLPALQITVLERSRLPYPEATHKVGESTVELASHYFSEVLGLKEHLKQHQLRKLGLRLFFKSENNDKIELRPELGANKHLSVPTYQIDRGRFENHLVDEALKIGVQIITQAKVTDVETLPQDGAHVITYEHAGAKLKVSTRWVIDATGRAAVLKRRYKLQEPSEHDSNAVWFRIKGQVNIDDWSNEPSWRAGHDGIYSRWYSTNHLTGKGYWVWLIPLASGYTSIGVVTDPKTHPLSHFRSFEDTLAWMQIHEPQCAMILAPLANHVADFMAIKHYAHKCSRVLSSDRWAITGDAGIFIDPLYSPGSDFIAIQNSFIVDVISRDMASELFIGRCELYNEIYMKLSEGVLKSFHAQYSLLGNARIMPFKIIWDYTIYWAFFAFIGVNQRFTDIRSLKAIEDAVTRIYSQNEEIQRVFREQDELDQAPVPPGFLDISRIPFLMELSRSLTIRYDDASFLPALKDNFVLIEEIYKELQTLVTMRECTWSSLEDLTQILAQIIPCHSKAA